MKKQKKFIIVLQFNLLNIVLSFKYMSHNVQLSNTTYGRFELTIRIV